MYLMGAYFGHEKLQDPNVFLQSLMNDLTRLINEGFRKHNKVIKITLFGLICDAVTLCTAKYTKVYTC